jgi:hypothetical protein
MEDADKPEVVRPADDVDRGVENWSAREGSTYYRVTDLWLFSTEDLRAMAAAFEARGLVVATRAQWIDATEYFQLVEPQWYWSFQTPCEQNYVGPEANIVAFLSAIEALDPPTRAAWAGCSQRVFDVAYDCGTRPLAVRHNLSAGTLARMAAVDGTLRLTLYALDPREIKHAEPDAAADGGGT